MDPLGFTFGLILPVAALMVLAVFIPRALFSRMEPVMRSIGYNLALSALLLSLAGAACFAAMYLFQGSGVMAAILSEPLGAGLQFLKLGVFSGLIWGPVLLLTLFGLAQRVAA